LIVNADLTQLLGVKTAQEIQLLTVQRENILSIEDGTPNQGADPPNLTKERVMRDYSDVFGEELGCMKGKVNLETDLNVAPAVMPWR